MNEGCTNDWLHNTCYADHNFVIVFECWRCDAMNNEDGRRFSPINRDQEATTDFVTLEVVKPKNISSEKSCTQHAMCPVWRWFHVAIGWLEFGRLTGSDWTRASDWLGLDLGVCLDSVFSTNIRFDLEALLCHVALPNYFWVRRFVFDLDHSDVGLAWIVL